MSKLYLNQKYQVCVFNKCDEWKAIIEYVTTGGLKQ